MCVRRPYCRISGAGLSLIAARLPCADFRQITPSRRDAHLRAITALSAQGIVVPEVQLRDTGGRGFTFITDGLADANLNQVVQRQLASLPAALGLRRVMLYQSTDARLGLNVFDTKKEGDTAGERRFGARDGEPTAETIAAEADAVAQIKQYAAKLDADPAFAAAEATNNLLGECRSTPPKEGAAAALSLDGFLALCPSSYVVSHAATPHLLCKQMNLFRAVAGGYHGQNTTVPATTTACVYAAH
jgi:hypothetical protein